MTREEWLKARRAGIGGSDAGPILGARNAFRDSLAVYSDKVGLSAGKPETEPMYWGNVLEAPIANVYSERTGKKLIKGAFITSPKYPWMLANPDFVIADEKKGLEVKTARDGFGWGTPGTDEVPESYLLQCAHYMACLDFDEWDIAVLIGGSDFRIYTIKRDRELENHMITCEQQFWTENVLKKVPPAAEPKSVSEYLKAKYPNSSGAVLNWNGAPERLLLTELKQGRYLAEKLDEANTLLENAIKAKLGDAVGCECDVGTVHWKNNKDGEKTDWRAAFHHLASLYGGPLNKIIEANTVKVPGARPFKVTFKK